MNKKMVIWTAALIAVAAIAVGTFIFIGRDTTDAPAAINVVEEAQPAGEVSTAASTLSGLLKSGQAQQCTFNFAESDSTGSGTIFFASDERMRGDFTVTSDGETHNGHVINDGSAQYFWQAGSSQGMKTVFSSEDLDHNEIADTAADYGFDKDKEYDFNCAAWNVDETMFMPPSRVDFVDMSSLLQQQ